MKPFNQSEEAFTKTALNLKPTGNQMYSAAIQQTPTRGKLNPAVVQANLHFITVGVNSHVF